MYSQYMMKLNTSMFFLELQSHCTRCIRPLYNIRAWLGNTFVSSFLFMATLSTFIPLYMLKHAHHALLPSFISISHTSLFIHGMLV
jgi:hypothetical protein